MAEDVKAEDVLTQLRDSFAGNIRAALRELPAHQALQIADALCTTQVETLAGLRVRYAAAQHVDGEAITEDWRRGRSLREIIQAHGVSRTTAYKYHPDGRKRRRAEAPKNSPRSAMIADKSAGSVTIHGDHLAKPA